MKMFKKLTSAISSETLGEVKKKPPKEIKSVLMENTQKPLPTREDIENKSTSKYPVLKLLNIELEPTLDNLITAHDVDNTEFTITAPTGLSVDEVTQFCDRVQRDITQYERVIKQRQDDFMLLLNHSEELVQKIVDQKQEAELASFIIEERTAEEKLRQQIVDLRLENDELRKRLNKLSTKEKTNQLTNNKSDSIIVDEGLDKKDKSANKLPELPTDEDDLLSEIEALY